MSTSLSEVLLRVASAIAADGGASVQAALEGVLRDAVPFEAGEVVVVPAHGEAAWRQPLGAAETKVLGNDLLAHVVAHGAAYRIDDWRDAEPFAETLGLLRVHSLRSLIVVPFRCDRPEGPPLAGALALGRSHGWAFVGASLPLLVPFAAMAGLALDRARVLTGLAERARPVEAPSPVPLPVSEPPASSPFPPAPDPVEEVASRLGLAIEQARQAAGERERERDQARGEREALRREVEEVARALRDEGAKSGDLRSRAEAAEARLREAEGSRDEWAQKAASLQAQVTEGGASIESLRRELAGLQETAAGAGARAEEGQARIRELQEQVEAGQGAMRTLEARIRGWEGESHRLGEASARMVALENELRRASEIHEGLEHERTNLRARLDEAAGRLEALERDRQALESARDEGEAARAQLVRETGRLEAEHQRLEGELTQVKAELQIALDQIGALSVPVPAVTPPSRGGRGGRKARGGRP